MIPQKMQLINKAGGFENVNSIYNILSIYEVMIFLQ